MHATAGGLDGAALFMSITLSTPLDPSQCAVSAMQAVWALLFALSTASEAGLTD